jgi:hypothetical protein
MFVQLRMLMEVMSFMLLQTVCFIVMEYRRMEANVDYLKAKVWLILMMSER